MCCTSLLILGMFGFGVFALAKGELRITGSKIVTDTTARILGGSLLVGAALGFLSPIISLVVFIIVIVVGLFMMEDTRVGTKDQKDAIYMSDDPYHPNSPAPRNTSNNSGSFQPQPANNSAIDFRSDFDRYPGQDAFGMPSLNHIDADDRLTHASSVFRIYCLQHPVIF